MNDDASVAERTNGSRRADKVRALVAEAMTVIVMDF
jgi:hypothetical protein